MAGEERRSFEAEGRNKVVELEALLQKAKRLAKEHHTGPEAIEVNSQILKIDPNQVGSYTRRGTCFLGQGTLEAAEKDFRNALERDPQNRIAANRLKEVLEMRCRDEQLVNDNSLNAGRSFMKIFVV